MTFLPLWMRPWALPLLVLLFCGLGLSPVMADDAKEWHDALDLGGRTIVASLLFTVVGIVIIYAFVGPIWRDFFASLLCIATVVYQSPEIIQNPAEELTKRYNSIIKMKPDDDTMILLFFCFLAAFFALRMFIAILERSGKDHDE